MWWSVGNAGRKVDLESTLILIKLMENLAKQLTVPSFCLVLFLFCLSARLIVFRGKARAELRRILRIPLIFCCP